MEKATSSPLTHVVEFRLGDDRFGVNVARVFEVIRYPKVRRLPHTPPFLEGAAELRGAVLPIVDLRKRFGLDPGDATPETRVVITEVNGERIGLIVDRVLGVTRLTPEDLQAAPKFFKGLAARYLEAMVNREGHQTIVLNTDEILTSKEKIQLRGKARPASAPPPPDETEEDSG
jgi:purine-binding chemotaxis protein CheW